MDSAERKGVAGRSRDPRPQPLNLCLKLYGDEATERLLDEGSYVRHLVRVEQAVAQAQGELGIIDQDVAEQLVARLNDVRIDFPHLWAETRIVGYPVLPLIKQIDGQLPVHLRGNIHWGLTTQDVMDTALVLQLQEVLKRQYQLIVIWGDALSELTLRWADSEAPARTHAQIAVPTTIGARFAVFLDQLSEVSLDLLAAAGRISRVSLHGAGGTSAAMGPQASEVRRRVARLLRLDESPVPWHVARQSLARLTGAQTSLAMVASRLAKDVIDLSRNEISEISEQTGHLRGASSTMPQKANPIDAEAIIGLAWSCTANQVAMLRALEAGHERSAGEWQIEWAALPGILQTSSAALLTAGRLSATLQVHPDRAAQNLAIDGNTVLSEAYMMQLATVIGRAKAHDLVYNAVRVSAAEGIDLSSAVTAQAAGAGDLGVLAIAARDCIGDAPLACASAAESWKVARAGLGAPGAGSSAGTDPIEHRVLAGRPQPVPQERGRSV